MTLTYQNNLIPWTRDELVVKVQQKLSEKRFNHCLGVEQAAIELANRFGGDVERAAIAGLCHDYAKEVSADTYRSIIVKEQLNPDLLNWGNNVWHGYVGPIIIENELQIHDQQILNAIQHHTMGCPMMPLLDQIIFVADYIEPGRDFTEVTEARMIAEKDLSAAVYYELKTILSYLTSENAIIFPDMLLTYNSWLKPTK